MNKINNLISLAILTTIAFQPQQIVAQSPEKMSYQAVVRDANNDLIINQSAGMRISILQGSTSGTSVYSETQNPTTNANGLVSIEIGTGTTSDDFSTVDWANGPYFIKTETDLGGGTNYSITGTSQLMSVPYALHAKTAGSVTGGISESDPIFKRSFAFRISQKDTAKWNDHTKINSKSIATLGFALGAHRDSTDIADMGFVAGSGDSPVYSVGLNTDLGGYVFYVTPNGEHGLVAALQDQSSSVSWYEANDVCNDPVLHEASGKEFTDWRLPTKRELDLMYNQKAAIGAFANFVYWCSTEFDELNVWGQFFANGGQDKLARNNTLYIRSVRAF